MNDSKAFNGSFLARTGFHNDAFLANSSDMGTYSDRTTDINYIGGETKYTPFGGETVDDNGNHSYNNCGNAIYEMDLMHMSYQNIDWHPNVIQYWKDSGCYDEIKKRLGYRFVMKQFQISDEVEPGGVLQIIADITNVGFSSPFNQRPVKLLLIGNSASYTCVMNTDVRKWYTKELISFHKYFQIPKNIIEDHYKVALYLPDYYSSISSDARYAIRFANQNVWNSSGYNVFDTDCYIHSGAGGVTHDVYTFYETDSSALSTNGGGSIGPQGALKISFTITNNDGNVWAEKTYSTLQDWSSYSSINFYARGDGSFNGTYYVYIVQDNDNNGSADDRWYYNFNLSGTNWTQINIPFSSFLDPSWDTDIDTSFDVQNIFQLYFMAYANNGAPVSGNFWVDECSLDSLKLYTWNSSDEGFVVNQWLGYGGVSQDTTIYYYTNSESSDSEPPSTPQLIEPSDGYSTSSSLNTFRWLHSTDNIGVTNYIIDVDRSSTNFTDIEKSFTVYTTNIQMTLSAGTKYWRVRALDKAGNMSGYMIFTLSIADTTAPSTPSLISPANSQSISNTTVSFYWKHSTDDVGIDHYEITIASDSGFSQIEKQSSVTTTNVTYFLTDGTKYWKVAAYDTSGNSSGYSVWTFSVVSPDTNIPTKPVLIAPVNNGALTNNFNISFFWNHSIDNVGIDHYKIDVATDNGFSTIEKTQTLIGTNISFALSIGTKYWRVIAYDTANNTSDYDVFQLTIYDTEPPSSSILITPTNNSIFGSSTISFKWSSSSDNYNVDHYEMEISKNNDFNSIETIQSTPNTNISLNSLTNGVKYWRVKSIDTSGNVSYSKTNNFILDMTPPESVNLNFPTNYSSQTNHNVQFVWNKTADALSGVKDYLLDISFYSTFSTVSKSTIVNDTNCSIQLNNGTNYWRVRARDKAGNLSSSYSIWSIDIYSDSDNEKPSTPNLVSPTNNTITTNSNFSFVWNHSTDNVGVDHYKIDVSKNSGFSTIEKTQTLTGTNVNFTLSLGTKYWRVFAYDSAGNQSLANVYTLSIVNPSDTTPPSSPHLLTPFSNSTISNTSVTFEWNNSTDSSGIDYYKIDVSKDSSFNTIEKSQTLTGTNITLTLSSDSKFWRVTAYDTSGNDSSSVIWNFSIVLPDTIPPTKGFLLLPENLSNLTNKTVSFVWKNAYDDNGIDRYVCEISSNNTFTSIEKITNLSVTNFIYSPLGLRYWWRVKAYDTAGNYSVSDSFEFFLEKNTEITNDNYEFLGEFYITPNPVNFLKGERLEILLRDVTKSSDMTFYIYDIAGNLVKTLHPDNGVVKWNGETEYNLTTGVYFVVLKTKNKIEKRVYKIGIIK